MASDAPILGVATVLVRDGRLLLGLRLAGAGAGTWSLPGGKLERYEDFRAAAVRELREETGLEAVDPPYLFCLCTTIEPAWDLHSVTVGAVVDQGRGEARALEPDKFEEWRWFAASEAPGRIFPPSVAVLSRYLYGPASEAHRAALQPWLDKIPPPDERTTFRLVERLPGPPESGSK